MTRCYKSSSTLKSSVFNQTGQTFIDQVEVQRTLCSHFRRILTAKSVVDSRNPKYMKMMQRKTRPTTAKKFLLKCPSDETIEKLAYDTEHHPCDLVRVQCRSKSTSHDRSWNGDRQRPINSDANYPRPKAHTSRDRSSTGKLHEKNKRPASTARSQQQSKGKSCNTARRSSRSNGGCKYEEVAEQRNDRGERGRAGNFPPGYQLQESSLCRFEEQCYQSEEEARYARFVYDITQEIVQNGLYTDCELKEVFEKHLQKNSGHLSRRKMLYEIYQLKISLNMMDDTEDEDEVEADLVFAEKFSTHRVPKPPTPPKILNENKVIEKLESFKQFESCRQHDPLADIVPISSPCRKSVTLVDANPEFLVTERDVLSTLADNHVEPHQIERICRNLYQKSKDMSLCEAVQVGSEVAYTYRLKQVDRCTSAASLSDICYSKKESRGILRKDCGTASKSLSPMSFRKFGFVRVKGNDGQEKCARWAVGECDCEELPCTHHREPPERLKKASSTNIENSSTSIPEQNLKAQQSDSTKCNCSDFKNKHYAANAEICPEAKSQKRSSLKKFTEKSAIYNDYIKYEKFGDDVCDCEVLPCSEHSVPLLKLNRRSTVTIPSEDEKWKKEDSTELTHAEKETPQTTTQKSKKCSGEEKNHSRKSSKTSNAEEKQTRKTSQLSQQGKNLSRKSSKLSEQEEDESQSSSKLLEKDKTQSQNSNKLSEREKGDSRKSSKLSGKNKRPAEISGKLTQKEIERRKDEKEQPARLASARRSTSESSLSDMQPEVRKPSKTRKQKTNLATPQTPVIMRSRLPSGHLKNEERISTESSEISSESDEPTANAVRRPSQLSANASKGSAENPEQLHDNEGDGEEQELTPMVRSRKMSLTTSADTSNRTSGELDIDYSKIVRRSTVESQKEPETHSELSPQAPRERKKDVPKDRMPIKSPLVSKITSKISHRCDSLTNKCTLSGTEIERERTASSALSRVLINVLDSPKSSRISAVLALASKPLQEDVLMEKLEQIQSVDDENNSKENQARTSSNINGIMKTVKPNGDNKLSFNITNNAKKSTDSKRSLLARQLKNRKSSVLFQSGIKSPRKRDKFSTRNSDTRKSYSSMAQSRRSSGPIEKLSEEEKQTSSEKNDSSEEEEIEEEIDTASETTARSSRGQTKKEAEREAGKERQMLAREAAKVLLEEEEDEEEGRYSDDFSDASDSPRKSEEAAKVQQRKIPSMKDFLESFAQMNEPKPVYLSSGSSESGSPSMLSLNVPSGSLDETALSTPVIKKRTSSGFSGYKVMESWNERLSELSSDFYGNPTARYCDPRCRSSLIAKTCSEHCKFAKSNCSHINEPTDCLMSDGDNSVASTQESSF